MEDDDSMNVPPVLISTSKTRDQALEEEYGDIFLHLEKHMVTTKEWSQIASRLSSIIGISEDAASTTTGGDSVDILTDALYAKVKEEEKRIVKVLLESAFLESNSPSRMPFEDIYISKKILEAIGGKDNPVSVPTVEVDFQKLKKEMFTSSSIIVPIFALLLKGAAFDKSLASLLIPFKEEKIPFSKVIKAI